MTKETPDKTPRDVSAPPTGLIVPLPDGPPAKRKGGAPKGNLNSMRHGLRSSRVPNDSSYMLREANIFRTCVEAAILDRFGSIDVLRAALVQTCIQWQIHAMKLRRLLLVKATELTIDQMVNFAERACRALAERDRCLVKMGLDKDDERHTTLYQQLPDEPQDGEHGGPEAPGV